jgi:hypothetical protein
VQDLYAFSLVACGQSILILSAICDVVISGSHHAVLSRRNTVQYTVVSIPFLLQNQLLYDRYFDSSKSLRVDISEAQSSYVSIFL